MVGTARDGVGAPREATASVIAHVLRRLSFGPHPGQVTDWLDDGPDALIEAQLDGPALPIRPQTPTEIDFRTEAGWAAPMTGWFENIKNPAAGLHEKMTWFWHGHLTSSIAKAESLLMYRQHRIIRERALGNFRDLVKVLTTDGAMLQWLDGDGSTAPSPNENHSRELLELFVLGPGNYTESDVRAGALALAGWRVEWPSLRVVFDSELSHRGAVSYLGSRGDFGPDDLVERACAHPACAPFIAEKLHRFLVGTSPSPARLTQLAQVFRDNDLEILPLVRAIVTHRDFTDTSLCRTKLPIEWLIGAVATLGRLDDIDVWSADRLGQLPLSPPNPAGWPDGPIWLSAQQQLDRLGILNWFWVDPGTIVGEQASVDEVLTRCALHEISATTRNAIERAAAADAGVRHTLMFRVALTSSEYQLA